MDIDNIKLEKFTGYGSKVSRKISINRSNGFSIPRAFLQENNINDVDFSELFFDKESKVIGIRFKKGEGEGGCKLIPYGNKEGDRLGVQFSAKSFFNTYNLDAAQYAGQYEAVKKTTGELGDVFLIQLKPKEAALPV